MISVMIIQSIRIYVGNACSKLQTSARKLFMLPIGTIEVENRDTCKERIMIPVGLIQDNTDKYSWSNAKGSLSKQGQSQTSTHQSLLRFQPGGELCNAGNCRCAHKCRFCRDNHPVVRCRQAQGKQARSGNTGLSASPTRHHLLMNDPTVWGT